MDYSKIPFQIIDDPKTFPGKLSYLTYPAPEEKSVFIHPIRFSLFEQEAGKDFSCDFAKQKLLFYCLEGNGTLHYQGHPIAFRKGDGFFLDGYGMSGIYSETDGTKYTIYFMSGDLAEELQKISEERNAFAFDSEHFHDFEQREFFLIRSFPGKLYGKDYDFSCHMNHLLIRILQIQPDVAFPENDKHRQMIQQVLTYMQKHFAEDIYIKDLAAHFNYSTSQFQKCFQEQTHTSAKQYLIQIRIREAKKLLLNTDLPIEEICTRCGFNNANHFIRVFREYNGKTPLQYRKENQQCLLH